MYYQCLFAWMQPFFRVVLCASVRSHHPMISPCSVCIERVLSWVGASILTPLVGIWVQLTSLYVGPYCCPVVKSFPVLIHLAYRLTVLIGN